MDPVLQHSRESCCLWANTKLDRMSSLNFLNDCFQAQFQEQPIDMLVKLFRHIHSVITCLMDGSAIRSLEDRDLSGMLENWLYLPSCTISRGDGSTEEESRIVRVAILEVPRLFLLSDPCPVVRDGDKSIPP